MEASIYNFRTVKTGRPVGIKPEPRKRRVELPEDMLIRLMKAVSEKDNEAVAKSWGRDLVPDKMEPAGKKGKPLRHLEAVQAVADGRNTREQVSARLGVSIKYAGELLSRARKAGLLKRISRGRGFGGTYYEVTGK